jgi:exonuclease SbcD
MRIIHTADWHLGRVFQQVNLLADQELLLAQIFDAVCELKPDLFIIAGDIFDRANPRRDALELFNDFLSRVYHGSNTAIVAIAGNHDAGELIGYGSDLHDGKRVMLNGLPEHSGRPMMLADSYGHIAISALPFTGVFRAREYFGNSEITTQADVVRHQMEEARQHIPAGVRWIVVAHAFARGGEVSSSERLLDLVGGAEVVPADIFSGAQYVALGHLHRAQRAGCEHIRYSGSLMPYGFDETDREKSLTMIDMNATGDLTIDHIPLVPQRTLAVIEGKFDEIMQQASTAHRDDFVKIRLLDKTPVYDAINRLRTIYPNTVQLEWVKQAHTDLQSHTAIKKGKFARPLELFEDFYKDVTGNDMSAELGNELADTVSKLADD